MDLDNGSSCQGICLVPYDFFENDIIHFWIHYGLCVVALILAIITVVVQFRDPVPYGKHQQGSQANWGFPVPQRLAHCLSDSIPGVLFFTLIFFLYGRQFKQPVNLFFYLLWEIHFVHRGLIHPWVMRYSSRNVAIGITVGNFFPAMFYNFLNAEFLGFAKFAPGFAYFWDPRFIIGVALFVTGFVINRWADWKLRLLRAKSEPGVYKIPRGGLFELVTCPNYLGELVEWVGWAVATFSWAGLVWCLFCAATLVPRSKHNREWYIENVEGFPKKRRNLIPFLY